MIIERVVTVEYLEPSMSRELLCKFPDNSAFDFDYSQSALWSPLIPRGYASFSGSPMKIQRKLSYGLEKITQENFKKVTTKIKTNITTKIKKKKKISDLSPTPVKGYTPRKGWTKVLKAASKQFKRKKKDSPIHVKLSNFLRD
ncbi:hypothetical protein HHK36_000633 [Tetracentron sinense]|uniref:Uncharacterized protein n=1 Tax=Tetracentron sinense TaxID=13715 RepID=A0A834ZVV2_TETSI|nr:hypothetical protein HHK36_000633 [Tetracentron sinense]